MGGNSLEVFIDELRELYRAEQHLVMSRAEAPRTSDRGEFQIEFDEFPTQDMEGHSLEIFIDRMKDFDGSQEPLAMGMTEASRTGNRDKFQSGFERNPEKSQHTTTERD